MIDGRSVIAVIPARGGSKRTFRKNLRAYKGKALVKWAMEHAEGSRYVDRIVVSTEDEMIGKVAEMYYLPRPDYLATDKATSDAVLVHALYSVPGFDYAVLLQPTSPKRIPRDIDRCIEMIHKGPTTTLNEGYSVVSTNQEGKRNGAVYVVRVADYLSCFSMERAYHYEMPDDRSLDIDYPHQFHD